MRIPSRWFTRRAQHLFLFDSPGIALTKRSCQNVRSLLDVPFHFSRQLHARRAYSVTRSLYTDDASSNTVVARGQSLSATDTIGSTEVKRIQTLSEWMVRLNEQLPSELQIVKEISIRPESTQPSLKLSLRSLDNVFVSARRKEGIEVLLWLVQNGYRKTAVWLMEAILNLSNSKKRKPAIEAPSNLNWPSDLFAHLKRSPVAKTPTFRLTTDSISHETQFASVQLSQREAQADFRLLRHVWETLGILIIDSAQAGTDDVMDDNMLTALLVLAHVHNLGMMPDNVYAYTHSDHPTHSQRPPILNLVRSRVLAALSDVAWRQQQDDAISLATRMGMSLKEISKNVPGGRFRLKVRPLAPEIWLELILWCCIESDQIDPALTIIAKLAAQAEEPWFAARWTSPRSREDPSTRIDWDRVKLRHGGPAGLIEGYSREKPFVDVPDKTVSVEVVLALIEKLLASIVSPSVTNVKIASTRRVHKREGFRPLRQTMSDIQDVMTFLEPHDLDIGYFDYLESRLLQGGSFDLPRAPIDLYTWTTRMRAIRDLKRINPEKTFEQSLQLNNVQVQSQLHLGIQHQALGTLVEFGDVHNTLAVLNEIQESVDESKVASIQQFLQLQQPATVNDIPTPHAKHDLEFAGCHGQLPYYKLAGLLNLISDTGLVGLGRWLLYAQEVDGAALPENVWGLPCMTSALYRFAAVSQDEELLEAARLKRPPKLLPSVKMLRTLADTNLILLRLQHATKNLESLKVAKGGGFGLSNVANIAATILRLEQRDSEDVEPILRRAVCLLEDIIYGRYSSTRSDFTLDVQRIFKRQIHHMLVVFLSFRGSILQRLANRNAARYPYSNLALLPAKHFNVLLSAGIDVYGAEFGKCMWQKMCKTPDNPYAAELFDLDVESLPDLVSADGFDEPDLLGESDASRNFGVSPTQIGVSDRQDEQSSTDEDVIQFDDPFFPKGTPGVVDMFQATPREEESNVSVPFETESALVQSDDKPISPLVIPNLNTLRLITRAAVRELKSREEAGHGVTLQRYQLAWSVQMFKAFGITDATVVEQEIQLPLSELNAEIVETADKATEVDKHRFAQSAIEQDLAVGSPVSEMWLPLTQTGSGTEFLNST